MPSIFVLDLPEYQALVDPAKQPKHHRVTFLHNGYYRVDADVQLVFDRRTLGFPPAVWYGAFTGGVDGRITQFDRDTVRVELRNEPD